MIEGFFSPANAPFAVALCLMGLIALVEIIGALMGMGASDFLDGLLPEIEVDADLDVDLDIDAEMEFDASTGSPLDADIANAAEAPTAGLLAQMLGWLYVGRVPVLILMVAFLTSFGLTGFVLQASLSELFGFTLPAVLACVPAFLVALPATRGLGMGLSKIMPKEETEAVSQKGFVGRIATIIRGEAVRGLPAEAKLTDQHGQTHYLLVEPDEDEGVLKQGDAVLIVRFAANRYRAIPNPNPVLADNE